MLKLFAWQLVILGGIYNDTNTKTSILTRNQNTLCNSLINYKLSKVGFM